MQRDLEDAGALVELARLALRTGVVPPLFQEASVRQALGRAWLVEPRERALWEFVLPVLGLEVVLGKPLAPGEYWARTGRLGEEDELFYDLLSDMPLHFRRLADGASMLLVPAFEGNRRPFLMDRDPVTQGRWRRLLGREHASTPPPPLLSRLFGAAGRDRELPLHALDRKDASEYLRRVEAQLPSVAEWQAAASGGDGRPYPWGEAPPTLRHANLGGPEGHPHSVASTPLGTSPFGLRDMFGNVRELTRDRRDSDSLMSERSWASLCGAGYRDSPGEATLWTTRDWRYTRDAPPEDMGFRLMVALEELPGRLGFRG